MGIEIKKMGDGKLYSSGSGQWQFTGFVRLVVTFGYHELQEIWWLAEEPSFPQERYFYM